MVALLDAPLWFDTLLQLNVLPKSLFLLVMHYLWIPFVPRNKQNKDANWTITQSGETMKLEKETKDGRVSLWTETRFKTRKKGGKRFRLDLSTFSKLIFLDEEDRLPEWNSNTLLFESEKNLFWFDRKTCQLFPFSQQMEWQLTERGMVYYDKKETSRKSFHIVYNSETTTFIRQENCLFQHF